MNMFRNVAGTAPVANWWDNNGQQIDLESPELPFQFVPFYCIKMIQHLFKFLQQIGIVTATSTWQGALLIMGGDSCSEELGFKSQHQILDVNFSH